MTGDKSKLPPLWAMTGTEDLLRVMWQQGEFEPFGMPPTDKFDPALAQKAFESYAQYQLKKLHAGVFPIGDWEFSSSEDPSLQFAILPVEPESEVRENLLKVAQDPNIIAPESSPVVVEFIEIPGSELDKFFVSQDTQGLIQLYANTNQALEQDESYESDKNVLEYIYGYQYLSALERGEPLPFDLPPFDPNKITGKTFDLLYDNSYAEHTDALFMLNASLLSDFGALKNVSEDAPLYTLWQELQALSVDPTGKPDPQAIEETLRTFLGENATVEDMAIFTQIYGVDLLASLGYDEEGSFSGFDSSDIELDPLGQDLALQQRLLSAMESNTLFLQALQADKLRQAAYVWRPLLAQLQDEFGKMPDEILEVPVSSIKEAFKNFYEIMNGVLDPKDILVLEQNWEQIWETLEYDPTESLVPLILIGASIYFPLAADILAGPELAALTNVGLDIAEFALTGDPLDLLFIAPDALEAIDDIAALRHIDDDSLTGLYRSRRIGLEQELLEIPLENRRYIYSLVGAMRDVDVSTIRKLSTMSLDELEQLAIASDYIRYMDASLSAYPGARRLSWRVENEIDDPNAIKQATEWSCQLACAEMIAKDQGVTISQQTLLNRFSVPPDPEILAETLNSLNPTDAVTWIGEQYEGSNEAIFNYFSTRSQGSWGAILTEPGMRPHMVVVDGLEEGKVLIRDPWGKSYIFDRNNVGSSYIMEIEEFFRLFAGGGLRRE